MVEREAPGRVIMRFIVSFFCALVICSGAKANELVVGEQGSVTITLPNQPNDQKCNIEVKFADGSSQDIEVDPKNLSKSISFTPTIAGTQIIQWDGKMKWRGLKSRPPCKGDGKIEVSVRDSDEVLAEKLAAQLKEDELFREGSAAFKRGNYQSALEILTPLAEAGRVSAQFILGIIFELGGEGIASDTEMALSWYERAAAQGDPTAKTVLDSLREKVAQEARIRAEQEAQAQIENEKQKKRDYLISFANTAEFGGSNSGSSQAIKDCALEMGLAYINGEFQLPQTPYAIDNWKRFSEHYVYVCSQFLSRLKSKNWWRSFVPPDTVDCYVKNDIQTQCVPHYEIQRNGQWERVSPTELLAALEALNPRISVPENIWRLSGTETDALFKKRCQERPLSEVTCPGYEQALAQKKADECRRNPLSDNSCPGYAAAKEEQEKREAEAEKQRQIAAARERRREAEVRNDCDKNPLSHDSCPNWEQKVSNDQQFQKGRCFRVLGRSLELSGEILPEYQYFFSSNLENTVTKYMKTWKACQVEDKQNNRRFFFMMECATNRGVPVQDTMFMAGVRFQSWEIDKHQELFKPRHMSFQSFRYCAKFHDN